MKRAWIAGAILLAVLGCTLGHTCYINTFSRDLCLMLEEAEANAEAGDWEKAGSLTRTALERWEDRDTYLHTTLRHDETDEIYTGFREVTEFLQCREAGEYSAANARLIASLELMAEAERLTIKNIL